MTPEQTQARLNAQAPVEAQVGDVFAVLLAEWEQRVG